MAHHLRNRLCGVLRRPGPGTEAIATGSSEKGRHEGDPNHEIARHGFGLHFALKTTVPSTVSVSPGNLAWSLKAQPPAIVKSALKR